MANTAKNSISPPSLVGVEHGSETIGSANADRVPTLGGGAYALTKAALQGMVRGLARDFGGRGITVNVVQPGPVDTDANPADGPFAAKLHGFHVAMMDVL